MEDWMPNPTSLLLGGTALVLCLTLLLKHLTQRNLLQEKLPPHIPSILPYLGHAVSFGKSPIEFLLLAYEKYGPVFSFTMVGKTFTYLLGSEASQLFFNSRNENLNAEDVYAKLVTPVFGKGVAYDVPNDIFLEQKKMFKTGLNIARFRQHVPIIQQETEQYFSRWGDKGRRDLFQALSEVIILTASRCLHGNEIYERLDEGRIAKLFWDLDGGFSPAAWLLPSWLPLPSFRKRDKAHVEMKKVFYDVIDSRRSSGECHEDMLQTLMDAEYKSGRKLTDEEIAGMLIGLLMAGQHTSSTTSAWLGFFLAQHQHIQEAVYEELLQEFGPDPSHVDYDGLKNCQLLERCVKETLRLRPPIMTMMRQTRTQQRVGKYIIPRGHQVCVSPTTTHRLPDTWQDCDSWQPDRFLDPSGAHNEEKFNYIPFGAGRHRCIGESFAYVQIKTIWSSLLRMFQFELVDGQFPEVNYSTMIHTPLNPVIRYYRRANVKN